PLASVPATQEDELSRYRENRQLAIAGDMLTSSLYNDRRPPTTPPGLVHRLSFQAGDNALSVAHLTGHSDLPRRVTIAVLGFSRPATAGAHRRHAEVCMPPESPTDRSRAEELLERFLRYVQVDTQSDHDSTSYPSTAKQLDLLRALEAELRAIGCEEVELDANGYLTATVPSTLPPGQSAPVVGLLAHVDPSPDVTGAGVKPIVWRGYGGGEIQLPGDPSQVVSPAETPELAKKVGDDVVTTDGTTLLGAD